MLPVILITALILSLLLVPAVRWLSFKLGVVKQPTEDRWHRKPTPALGGVGMFVAFTVSVLAVALLNNELGQLRWSLLAGSTLIFILGVVDDLKPLTPPAKFVVQIVAAAIVIFFGRVIHFFPWDFANIILTFFWLVGITNAINLLDNMDGLAGGIALIAAGFLSYFFWQANNQPLLLISLSLAGSILGFLIFNFPPAKIFMGDSGALFLGFTLAALAVAHSPRASDVFSVMGVPTLLFLLPILDTSLVTITRLLRGQSPAQGGTDHTSHRLIAFGLNERQTVLALYAVGIIGGLTGTVLEALDYDLSLVLVPILLISLSLLIAYLGRLKVVSSYVGTPGGITRLMVNLTYKRRLFEMVLDFFLIGVSYYLAFWTENGFQLSNTTLNLALRSMPVAITGAYISFFIFGIYRGLWQYVGIEELFRYARAALGGVILAAVPLLLLYTASQFSPVIFFLFSIFLFLGLAASRLSFTLLDRIYRQHLSAVDQKSVLIYDAEDAGEIALRWILRNPELGYNPIGFLDDDQFKWGRWIHGINVLGGKDQLESILANKRADGVIITSPVLVSNGSAEELIEICRKQGVWVRVLRMDFELLE